MESRAQGREARRFRRAAVARRVEFFDDGRPVTARAREISGGGVFVETDRPLPEGRFLTLRLDLADAGRPLTILGRVVRTVRGSLSGRKVPGMGIEFVDIRYQDRQRLLDCVGAR
ncbi:MAG: hypothetical protein D6729_05060 [Deltaproteobacteria bacterium]|nr:MAG: hypothetical protein D6729_05060 [Deltaproteobacteria bacterium]